MLPTVDLPRVNTGRFNFAADSKLGGSVWRPNDDAPNGAPNPQRLALESKADELYYGGAAGGGKTDLGIGAALTEHRRAAIFRRISPSLDAIQQRLIELAGDDDYNRGNMVFDGAYAGKKRRIELEHCQYEKDKGKQQGRPRDLYVFDEITEFTRTQYEFIIGWNRTTIKGQRCRVICTGNPPLDSDGAWVVEAWAPWLDEHFPDPAEPGELRYYYRDEHGNVQWSREPVTFEIEGKSVKAKSRTFIPARLKDNPHLYEDGKYLTTLNSMPEPMRTALLTGDFTAMRELDPFQIIPTEWVRAAQRRWIETPRPGGRPDGAGHDVARGGKDYTVYVERWGVYIDEPKKWPGFATPDGPTAASMVHHSNNGPACINTDVIGYGSSSHDSLISMGYNSRPVNVGSGSRYKDKSGKLQMLNLRAELAWRMRDALDPDSGTDLCLPPGNEILADLCSIRYQPLAGGKVKAESKEDIKKRLGRSPDAGDAVLLCLYDIGELVLW